MNSLTPTQVVTLARYRRSLGFRSEEVYSGQITYRSQLWVNMKYEHTVLSLFVDLWS